MHLNDVALRRRCTATLYCRPGADVAGGNFQPRFGANQPPLRQTHGRGLGLTGEGEYSVVDPQSLGRQAQLAN